MAVKVSKSKVNIRQKLTELDIPKGVHGTQLVASRTVGETFDLVKAGRRNLLHNGAMQICQRPTSQPSIQYAAYHGPDRWKFNISGALCGTWTVSQDTDVPTGQGFKKSYKMDCTATRDTLAAGSALGVSQFIEGQD